MPLKQVIAGMVSVPSGSTPGAGSALIRGSGVLQGFTTPPVPAEPPPLLRVEFVGGTTEFTFTLTVDSLSYVFQALSFNPGGGVIWIDSSTWLLASDAAQGLANAITAQSLWNLTASYNSSGGEFCDVSQAAASGNLLGDNTSSDASIFVTGGGDTTPEVPGSGEVSEVEIISQDGEKAIKSILLGYFTDSPLDVSVRFALKTEGIYYQLGIDVPNNEAQGVILPGSFWQEWVSDRISTSLVALMSGPTPTGGTLTCWAVAEQL